ncbi:MAG TPA: hypothetical protein VEH77_17795 [Roseiarcus sp.]|nr:hypothetical protein [Roseiarcus sp.]
MDAEKGRFPWIASAFLISLVTGVGAVAAFGVEKGAPLGLETTGRIAFLFFVLAYVGAPLTALFGAAFEPVRKRAREFGLAFTSVILVHLGLVASLCATGRTPPLGVFIVFGTAAACTGLLALLSIPRVRKLLPDPLWPPVRFLATTYILLAFLQDFRQLSPSSSPRHLIAYAPFAALAVACLLLKLAALGKRLSAAAFARLRRRSTSPRAARA